MSPLPLRPPQRAILEALDRHVLVSAGAGSGKTTTVVNVLLHRLGVPVADVPAVPPLGLDELAAITFTTAAAADLVTKLRAALLAAGATALADGLDAARIGTIHGFCGDLLRSLGLRGSHRAVGSVLAEGQARELLANAAQEALLDAIETDDLPGLGPILAQHRLSAVGEWIALLAEDGGRLEALRTLPSIGDPAVAQALVTLAERTRARMDAALAELPAVDFDRLLVWTRDLLGTAGDPGVRAAARRRLKLLVVDEFQDVDPVQRDIVYLLGGIAPREPSPTRLLLVGDPKQSIYRFRRADVSVWRQVERTFAEMGADATTLPLNESFRSVPGILAFVDHALGSSMAPAADAAPYEVAYQPLLPTRAPVGAAPAVEVLVQRVADGDKMNADARRAHEARAVVARLRALHGQPMAGPDGAPLEWRHMAILLPARAAMPVFEAACREAGVPCYLLRNAGLLESREVLDAILALRAVRDPRDRVAMAGVLRSPFVGLRDETLLALARGGALEDGVPGVPLPPDEAARLAAAQSWLARARQRRDRTSVHQLLAQLLDESGYRAHLALRGDSEARQALANLALFGRLLETDTARSVGGWLRELADRRARGDDVAPARLVGPEEPFVTITTIHAAKGLDWEVVAWGDLGRKPLDERGVSGLFVTRSGLGLRTPDVEWDKEDPALVQLRDEAQREARAERLRLRYVAATRARTRLIVSGVDAQPTKGSDAEWLAGVLGLDPNGASGTRTVTSAAGVAHPIQVTVLELHASADADADAAAAEPGRAPLCEAAAVPIARALVPVPSGRLRHSATGLMLHARCARRYAWTYLLGVREPDAGPGSASDAPPTAASLGHGMDARTLGTIVHEVLARADEARDLDALLAEVEADWSEDDAAPDSSWSDADRATIREQAARALAGRYGELAAHPQARRELRFVRVLPDGAALEGAVDLLAPEGEGVAIVDVKTGHVAPGGEVAAAARYALQAQAYRDAVAALSGRPVTRVEFLFTETMQVVAHAPQAGDAPVGDVVARVAAMPVADAPLARDPATCVGCGFKAAGWCPGAAP